MYLYLVLTTETHLVAVLTATNERSWQKKMPGILPEAAAVSSFTAPTQIADNPVSIRHSITIYIPARQVFLLDVSWRTNTAVLQAIHAHVSCLLQTKLFLLRATTGRRPHGLRNAGVYGARRASSFCRTNSEPNYIPRQRGALERGPSKSLLPAQQSR